jgi:hypothetical protein
VIRIAFVSIAFTTFLIALAGALAFVEVKRWETVSQLDQCLALAGRSVAQSNVALDSLERCADIVCRADDQRNEAVPLRAVVMEPVLISARAR